MPVYVNESDAQYSSIQPFGVISSSAGEVYEAQRDADVAGNQSWSETDSLMQDIEGLQESFESDFGFALDIRRETIWRAVHGHFDTIRKRDPRNIPPKDQEDIAEFDAFIEALDRAATEKPNKYKSFEALRDNVAVRAIEKQAVADRVAARAEGFDRFLGQAGAGLVRDINEPVLVLSALATAPIAAEYFGASLFARGLGIAATEGAAAGVSEAMVSANLMDFWERQGLTDEEINLKMLSNVGSASVGAATLSPAFYLTGVLTKAVANRWARALTSRNLEQIAETAVEIQDSGINLTAKEQADISILLQRLEEVEQMPPFFSSKDPLDIGTYQTNVNATMRALETGRVPTKLPEQLTFSAIPKMEQALNALQKGAKAPTRAQMKAMLTPDEFDQYNLRLKEARELNEARSRAPEIGAYKRDEGAYKATADDQAIKIEKQGKNWVPSINEERIPNVEPARTLAEAKEQVAQTLENQRVAKKTPQQIAREVGVEQLRDGISRRLSGPFVRSNIEDATPVEAIEVEVSPQSLANAKVDTTPIGRFTGVSDPDKAAQIGRYPEDPELSKRIDDGEFDEAKYKEAMEAVEAYRGRTPEESDLYTKLDQELTELEGKIADAKDVEKAADQPDIDAIEARMQELDARDDLSPDEKIELGELQEQLFEAENAPPLLKPDTAKMEAQAKSIRAQIQELDDKLAARQANHPFARDEDLEEFLNDFREIEEEEADLKELLQCVIRNNASG